MGLRALGPYSAGRIPEALASGWDSVGSADSFYRAEDLRFSIDSVISTMRALEAPRGRKVFLLLAGRWPTLFRPPGSGSLRGLLWTAPGADVSTDLELLGELVDTANLLGYTVYPMDQQTAPDSALWSNLRYVARETGGKAFMAGSNVKALDKVTFDTSNYYWLGFVPDYRRDNRARDIRVEVREPRLSARNRRGYLDLSRRTEADMEALQQLLFPPEVEAGGGPLLVEVGDAVATKGRTMTVPVTVHVPVGRFPAMPYDGAFRQQLELRLVALDRFRSRSETPAVALSLGGGHEPAPDEVVVYRASLNLRRRPHEVVVTVHDPVSRLTARGRASGRRSSTMTGNRKTWSARRPLLATRCRSGLGDPRPVAAWPVGRRRSRRQRSCCSVRRSTSGSSTSRSWSRTAPEIGCRGLGSEDDFRVSRRRRGSGCRVLHRGGRRAWRQGRQRRDAARRRRGRGRWRRTTSSSWTTITLKSCLQAARAPWVQGQVWRGSHLSGIRSQWWCRAAVGWSY